MLTKYIEAAMRYAHYESKNRRSGVEGGEKGFQVGRIFLLAPSGTTVINPAKRA